MQQQVLHSEKLFNDLENLIFITVELSGFSGDYFRTYLGWIPRFSEKRYPFYADAPRFS